MTKVCPMPLQAKGNGVGRVSVVIPAHNRADLLRDTLRSVAQQDEPLARVIVADDGSTDSTASVIEEFGAVRVHNPTGGWGPAGARNAALEHVETEYVAFLDSDDLWQPHCITTLREALDAAPDASFAYGRGLSAIPSAAGWRPDGLIGASRGEMQDLVAAIFIRNSALSSSALVRTEVARAAGGYDPEIVWAEDHHFWVKLAKVAAPVHVPRLVCVIRRHPGNRYTPSVEQSARDALVGLAVGDPRLEPHIPQRIGVELCEVVMSALRARRGRGAVP